MILKDGKVSKLYTNGNEQSSRNIIYEIRSFYQGFRHGRVLTVDNPQKRVRLTLKVQKYTFY